MAILTVTKWNCHQVFWKFLYKHKHCFLSSIKSSYPERSPILCTIKVSLSGMFGLQDVRQLSLEKREKFDDNKSTKHPFLDK